MSLILRPWYALLLGLWLLWDMTVSSIQVARAVLSPSGATGPRFVAVPLRAARSEVEITIVANYITLTPGTLTVDVGPDRRTLLVHSLLAGDTGGDVRRSVNDEIEPRVVRVTRG